jgi:hypothetical protein
MNMMAVADNHRLMNSCRPPLQRHPAVELEWLSRIG